MAARAVTEFTEIRRIPLNQAQGKKVQILELEWDPSGSVADGDHLNVNDLPGVSSLIALLNFQIASSSTNVDSDYADVTLNCTIRPSGGSNADNPTAADDKIIFNNIGTDSGNFMWLTLLVESD